MKKIALLLLALLLLVGCTPKLDPQYDKDTVLETAKTFLCDLNDRRYDDCADRFNGLMAAQFDAALLQDVMESTLDKAGAFETYTRETAYSVTEGLTVYAVVVLKARYENGSIQYTVSLDPDMAVAGFYFK